ncbi:hypothetical protein C9415_05250 [Kluyvera sp. Nf5]|nr:hypothetical protein C9415_05250 [Kluyvera sp. Nf5]
MAVCGLSRQDKIVRNDFEQRNALARRASPRDGASNSSQTDRRQRGGRRTQCEAPIFCGAAGIVKGNAVFPFTRSRVREVHFAMNIR